jgi:hypothetical protein
MLRRRSLEEPAHHQRIWLAGRPTPLDSQPWFVAIQPPPPHDEGRSAPVCQGSPCARGRGTHPVLALSPCPTIGKEHRSVTPRRPIMGILTLRKVTVRHQLVVPSSSSNDDLSLVNHDAQVDLNLGDVKIRYTQEPALVSDSPLPSPPPYIVSRQRVGVGHSKVLIPHPEYKGKGRIESASSNPMPRVQ